MFGQILVEFLFRLTFGVAVAMGVTDSRQVTSGFFRVHLWVLLGVQTLAALALGSAPLPSGKYVYFAQSQFWIAVLGAVLSYVGAVVWMYESRTLGKVLVWGVASASLVACGLSAVLSGGSWGVQLADRITGGLLLGMVTTAMLLGHWYLNTPTMRLAPLHRLIVLLAVAVLLRAAFCGAGYVLEYGMRPDIPLVFTALRWLAGIVGVGLLAGLTWQTLKIPNTQSATGILYAAVILAFIGELMSQLLSAAAHYPI